MCSSPKSGVPLKRVLEILEKLPYFPPPSEEATLALLNDVFRDLRVHPLSIGRCTDPIDPLKADDWKALHYLAFALRHTPLGEGLAPEGVRLQAADTQLRKFLDSLRGVPLETLPKNAFRREELLRKWIDFLGLPIEGETPQKSAARLSAVDYHRLQKTMAREEEERKRISAEWAKRLAEESAARAAAAAAAPSSGSYE